jgi:hypothetical protein
VIWADLLERRLGPVSEWPTIRPEFQKAHPETPFPVLYEKPLFAKRAGTGNAAARGEPILEAGQLPSAPSHDLKQVK